MILHNNIHNICPKLLFYFSKEGQAENATSETSNGKRGILKDTELNRSNVEGFGAAPSRRGSYLETLEKPHDQNERLNFHCSFENDDSPGQEIQIPCTQLVLPDKILEGKGLKLMIIISSCWSSMIPRVASGLFSNSLNLDHQEDPLTTFESFLLGYFPLLVSESTLDATPEQAPKHSDEVVMRVRQFCSCTP